MVRLLVKWCDFVKLLCVKRHRVLWCDFSGYILLWYMIWCDFCKLLIRSEVHAHALKCRDFVSCVGVAIDQSIRPAVYTFDFSCCFDDRRI
jgi:hypothetical protein